MSLSSIHLHADVLLQLTTYALCFEKEEVCSLLLGSFQQDYKSSSSTTSAHVTSLVFSPRKDKRRDRVEISPEQLSEAMEVAERTGKRVIGWAHSHPNITVFPSHVDLSTQLNLQKYSDPSFFGIIVSCFDGSKVSQKIQVTCFQTSEDVDGIKSQLEIPLVIVPTGALTSSSLLPLANDIMSMLCKEQREGYTRAVASDASALPVHSASYVHDLAQLLDRFAGPLLAVLQDRYERNMKELPSGTQRTIGLTNWNTGSTSAAYLGSKDEE